MWRWLGYGVVWLSIRGQQSYRAPAGWALALLALLAVIVLGVTAAVTDRAASGVGGASALRRRIYWLSRDLYAFGLGVWLIAVAALSGFAGPVGVWAVDALAVGIPFLLLAAIPIRRGWS